MEAGARGRILVVDDDERVREATCAVLSEAGFEVLAASNGDEALQVCREQSVDVVVCDMFMPDKDGLETIRALKRTRPGLKVVAVSGGFHGLDVLPMARLLGAAILAKPFKAAALVAVIDGLMKS